MSSITVVMLMNPFGPIRTLVEGSIQSTINSASGDN